jgi:hypothetical protein
MIAASMSRNIALYCALAQHRRVEGVGDRLAQHFDDAEVDATGAHHFIADVRQQIVEHARVRDRHHTLAGFQRQLLYQPLRDRRIVERQARLRGERGGEHERDDDE